MMKAVVSLSNYILADARAGIVIEVRNGSKLGTLTIGNGGLYWQARNKQKKEKMTWHQFASLFANERKGAKTSRGTVAGRRHMRGRRTAVAGPSVGLQGAGCSVHPTYHGKRPPVTLCDECWALYRANAGDKKSEWYLDRLIERKRSLADKENGGQNG